MNENTPINVFQDKERATEVNRKLKLAYGLAPNGKALFRVAWSENELEWAQGEYEEYYKGMIFMRRLCGTYQKKKYRGMCKDRWVLEKMNLEPFPDRPGSDKGHYEPVYIFQNGKFERLPLQYWPCELIILNMYDRRPSERWTEDDQRKIDDAEEQYFADFMENEHPILVTDLHHGHATSYSGLVSPNYIGRK